MTGSEVLFDTWAWVEVLHATAVGKRLRKTYLEAGKRVHTSALSIGEIVASEGLSAAEAQALVQAIERESDLHDVTSAIAAEGGRLRGVLREASRDASLADGIILATARTLRATLVSKDPAFQGESDVVPG